MTAIRKLARRGKSCESASAVLSKSTSLVLVQFRPEAEADVGRAYLWYEDKRLGLGDEFLEALDRAIVQIVAHPASGPLMHRTARRVLLDRFPYGVFYVIHTDEIHVLACFHVSLDPQHWRDRL
jgi:plasmid stabilization system protein ParE